MISRHCGQLLITVTDNKFYFRKRCSVCTKIFKQAKRQKAVPDGKE